MEILWKLFSRGLEWVNESSVVPEYSRSDLALKGEQIYIWFVDFESKMYYVQEINNFNKSNPCWEVFPVTINKTVSMGVLKLSSF